MIPERSTGCSKRPLFSPAHLPSAAHSISRDAPFRRRGRWGTQGQKDRVLMLPIDALFRPRIVGQGVLYGTVCFQ